MIDYKIPPIPPLYPAPRSKAEGFFLSLDDHQRAKIAAAYLIAFNIDEARAAVDGDLSAMRALANRAVMMVTGEAWPVAWTAEVQKIMLDKKPLQMVPPSLGWRWSVMDSDKRNAVKAAATRAIGSYPRLRQALEIAAVELKGLL